MCVMYVLLRILDVNDYFWFFFFFILFTNVRLNLQNQGYRSGDVFIIGTSGSTEEFSKLSKNFEKAKVPNNWALSCEFRKILPLSSTYHISIRVWIKIMCDFMVCISCAHFHSQSVLRDKNNRHGAIFSIVWM